MRCTTETQTQPHGNPTERRSGCCGNARRETLPAPPPTPRSPGLRQLPPARRAAPGVSWSEHGSSLPIFSRIDALHFSRLGRSFGKQLAALPRSACLPRASGHFRTADTCPREASQGSVQAWPSWGRAGATQLAAQRQGEAGGGRDPGGDRETWDRRGRR